MLQVAAGGYHTMCVTQDGSVLSFGKMFCGQLGVGDYENRLVPILLRGELENKSGLQVATGDNHTMRVTSDGLVFVCGDICKGQLGVGDIEDRRVPTLVTYTGQLQGKTAVYVAADKLHALCITADGSLFAWDSNLYGQLGVEDTVIRLVPTLVTGLQGKQVVHVAAGSCHTICTTADGSVFTWGAGHGGKLGLGDDQSNKLVSSQVKGELENKSSGASRSWQ